MPRVLSGQSFGRDLREPVEELRSSSSSGVAVGEDTSPNFGVKISDFGEFSFNPGFRFVIFGTWGINSGPDAALGFRGKTVLFCWTRLYRNGLFSML